MQTALNRRDVLKTIGGAGLAAVFGTRALDFLGDDAQAATTCRPSSARFTCRAPIRSSG